MHFRPSEVLHERASAPVEKYYPKQAERIREILAEIVDRRSDELKGEEVSPENLEALHGKLEDQPGWNNAGELAEANKDKWWFDPSAKWTMSPERQRYMQGVGRDVDFLKGYLDGGNAGDDLQALEFWDRSKDAKSTDNWDGANYQRFSGLGNQFASSVTDRAVPFGAFMQLTDAAGPNVLRWLLGGNTSAEDALERTHALNEFQKRYRLGKNPVLDIPTPKPGDGPAANWHEREAQLRQQRMALEPPSGHDVASSWFGAAPAFVGDAVDTLMSAFDPSMYASLGTSVPGKAVARAAMRTIPPRVAAKVGARDVASALGRQGVAELTPEAGFAAAVRAAAPASERSWVDYFTKPETAESTPDNMSESAARQMLSPDQMSVPDARTGETVGGVSKSAARYRPSRIP